MPLKIGVVGVGHMGRIHAIKLLAMDDVILVGIADTADECLEGFTREHNTSCFRDHRELLHVEAVVIATPTETHYETAKYFMEHGIHVFLEKPITSTPDQAHELIGLANSRGLVFQVGHLERFSPPFLNAGPLITNPLFIEAQRLSPFTGRSTDIDVVFDLMIHDIDLTLSIVSSDVREIRAQGTPVVTSKIDAASARIEFTCGCVANLTASRVSVERERIFRIFQKDRYLSIDLMRGKMLAAVKNSQEGLTIKEFEAERMDPVGEELGEFVQSIRGSRRPRVEGEDGLRALLVANDIKAEIERHLAGAGKHAL
jgi:predicted dehydrogenase